MKMTMLSLSLIHIYQGICDHTILIEFGGQNNTKEEVQNTIEVMSQVIKEYLQ